MFTGFSEKTSSFLWELAFHNERPWFLAHKQEFEDRVNTPFKELAKDVFALMGRRHPGFEGRLHLSRIYRDARRLFGRGPYKDHLWFSIKPGAALLEGPMFWFEFGAADYAYGMGFYSATPAQMAAFRKTLDANPARFLRLARALERKGWHVDGERYKRPKALHGDALLDDWYNRKWVGLERRYDFGGAAFTGELTAILADAYDELMPMYDYLTEIYDHAE